MPVAINLFASRRRMLAALQISSYDEWDERLEFFLDPKPPEGLIEKLKAIPRFTELASVFPKTVRSAPCQEIVETGDAVDLTKLPVLQCWPQDGGPFITLPLVITRDPASGKTNVGVYRMQVYDRRTTGMHWQKHKDGAGQARGYEREGRRMEVAAAIGCDPATVFSGIAPLPPGLSEFLFAGFVRGEGVPLVAGKTVDLLVPAEAEIVLEGYVDPGERRQEGPFGDHTGFYSLEDDFPVFHVTAVTRRRAPIYLTTIVGKPPMEDGFLGEAVERLFLPLVKKTIPEIVDMYLPPEGIFHNLMIVAIDKRFPGPRAKDDARDLGDGPDDVLQDDRRRGPGRAGPQRAGARLEGADGDRSGAGHRVRPRACRRARLRLAPSLLREQDGNRRDPEVERRRLRSPVARRDRDGWRGQEKGGSDLAVARHRPLGEEQVMSCES